jgi:hypothetical protein
LDYYNQNHCHIFQTLKNFSFNTQLILKECLFSIFSWKFLSDGSPLM